MISIQQDMHEQVTLKAILSLMETQGWDVDRAMDALKVDERDLYGRSVQYALEQKNRSEDERG